MTSTPGLESRERSRRARCVSGGDMVALSGSDQVGFGRMLNDLHVNRTLFKRDDACLYLHISGSVYSGLCLVKSVFAEDH